MNTVATDEATVIAGANPPVRAQPPGQVGDGGESGSHRNGRKVCGAKTRSGGRCRAYAMPNGRCTVHGGQTPNGIASPQYRHGRYSRYMPKALKKDYESALADTELLSLRDDVALLEARQAELLREMDSVAQVPWARVVGAVDNLARCKDSERSSCLTTLTELVLAGGSAAATVAGCWAELREVLQEKAKVVQAESRRLDEMHQTMTRSQAVLLMAEVAAAVRENVTDRQVLQRIQNRLNAVLLEGKVVDAPNTVGAVSVPATVPDATSDESAS
jgi:hypothetical protein